ncbi:MAG: hypothetical protein ABR576_03150 [Thermoanaerobaculia bacterium]
MALRRGRDAEATRIPWGGKRAARRRWAAILVVLAFCAPAPARDLPRHNARLEPPRPLDRPVRTSLARAIEQAAAKLEGARCREVFSDFRDRHGRTLQHNLDATGLAGAAHLRSLTFANGRVHGDCRLPNVLALATPGRQIIYICGPQFLQRERLDPGFTAALLIHEQLHALGLGENPPHSQEITARVISRCGR